MHSILIIQLLIFIIFIFIFNLYYLDDLHWILLQILDSKFLPLHSSAPESHFLTLDLIPPPQVWEHWDQLFQAPQEL